jgi:steroid 5-alpha reductase family enzyme
MNTNLSIINAYLLSLLIIIIYMSLWFLVSVIKKRNDIADTAWGLGFILIAILSLIFGGNISLKTALTTTLILIWGFRLSIHIYRRNINKKEDYRYKEMRDKWGDKFFLNSYIKVFLIQGFFLSIIVYEVVAINLFSRDGFSLVDALGVLVWLFGFVFESISDKQLASFLNKKDRPKVLNTGLWKYSRHPNYFGEVVMWWGIYIISFSTPYYFVTILSPLLITFLITKVSGIPLLEKKYEGNIEYEEYKKKTSVFIPLPKRK